MKKIAFVPLVLFGFLALNAQDTVTFKLDAYFSKIQAVPVQHFYNRKMVQTDSVWSFFDYSLNNKLIQKGFFSDTGCKLQTGHFEFYQNGAKLYEGDYNNNHPTGFWYFYSAYSTAKDSLFYKYSVPAQKATTSTNLEQQEKALALKNEHLKKDTTTPSTVVEKMPEFPGGPAAWKSHLIKNLYIPELVIENSPYSKGTVHVQFVVCKDGELCSIEALNSVHPLLDLNAVRAIRKSIKWVPAEQNGKTVKAYHRQPITYYWNQE